jgi:ceramide glucosyltransferase
MREFFRHQLRWSRTIRDARPWGYAGLLFTFGLPWALAMLVAAQGARWAWVLLALTLLVRLAVGVASEFVLQDFALTSLLLLPLRDLLAPLVWAAGFMGNRIHWRGDVFDLKDGRLRRASH